MGGACLRDHGHPRSVGGAGRPAPRRRREDELAGQPDAAGTDGRPNHLRFAHRHSFRLGETQPNPDTDGDAKGVGLGQPLGNGGDQCAVDAMPITNRDCVGISDSESESLRLALSSR
jgi:hypothetical protein